MLGTSLAGAGYVQSVKREESRVRIQMSFWSDLAGKPSSGHTDKGQSPFKPMAAGPNPAAGPPGSDRRPATFAVPGMQERRGLSVQRDASWPAAVMSRRGDAGRGPRVSSFPCELRRRRTALGWTLEQVAEQAHVSVGMLSLIETEKRPTVASA
jgi:hypothetical protein